MTNDILFQPMSMGGLDLPSRIVMAPMTRSRSPNRIATALNAQYYAQRASAALIISEGTQVSDTGVGYPGTPGLHSSAQVEGWRNVTSAVKSEGGRMYAQLWHVGRVSHAAWQPGNQPPLAPSPIALAEAVVSPNGMVPATPPREMTLSDIRTTISDFADAARNAILAGFDGVELHAANGYLIEQFLYSGTNQRSDEYGGAIENRSRFLLDIVESCTRAIGAARVGVRLSPNCIFHGMQDDNRAALFGYLASALNAWPLAYVHVPEILPGHPFTPPDYPPLESLLPLIRSQYRGVVIANGGYNAEKARTTLSSGLADLISFGSSFLANPDLPERLARSAPLNAPDPSTFYAAEPLERGYTDYPTMASSTP